MVPVIRTARCRLSWLIVSRSGWSFAIVTWLSGTMMLFVDRTASSARSSGRVRWCASSRMSMFMRRPAVEYWPTVWPPIRIEIVVAMSLTLTLRSAAAGRSRAIGELFFRVTRAA